MSSTVKHDKTYKAHLYELFVYVHGLFVLYTTVFLATIIILLYQMRLKKRKKRFMAYANSEGSREPAHPQACSIIIEFIKLVRKR